RAGLFDVSHMGEIRGKGPAAASLLDRAATNRMGDLRPGRARYTCLCDERGGTLDDLVALRLAADDFLLVVNAVNRVRDGAWLRGLVRPGEEVVVEDETFVWGLLAVQGPSAVEVLARAGAPQAGELAPFAFAAELSVGGVPCLVSRTGYTGEDGFECLCPWGQAAALWASLLEAGAAVGLEPAGLGARDTLRVEASLPLYGHELDESISPLEAGLGRFVAFDKGPFVGREALLAQRQRPPRRLVGLRLPPGPVPRQGAVVEWNGAAAGVVTSGSVAPTVGGVVAMALVDAAAADGQTYTIPGRGRALAAERVSLPFYRSTRRRAAAARTTGAAEGVAE
ncbi:MAG: glycine cleavage system aminomethyltransferase GcvT, partial [Clostridia bacterium]|nr:glycine cleavage system aminomethyltransferase GcvT [Clostridia bacterium]